LSSVVLIVDKDDARRARMRRAISFQRFGYVEAVDSFHAMGALGRAAFGAILVTEERRLLTVRSMFTLALKRHPKIKLFMEVGNGVDVQEVVDTLHLPVILLPSGLSAEEVAGIIKGVVTEGKPVPQALVAQPSPRPPSPPPSKAPTVVDRSIRTPPAAAPPAPQPSAAIAVGPSVSLDGSDLLQTLSSKGPPAEATHPAAESTPPVALHPAASPAAEPTPGPDTETAEVGESAFPADPPTPLFTALPETQTPPSRPEEGPELAASAETPSPEPAVVAPTTMDTGAVEEGPTEVEEHDVELLEEEVAAEAAASSQPVQPAPASTQDLGIGEETTVLASTEEASAAGHGAPEDEQAPLLEGGLEDASGPAVLVAVFAQGLTGRLQVQEGPAEGLLFFVRGEPVWAEDPRGDAGMFERVKERGLLSKDAVPPDAPEGQLVACLAQNGILSGQDVHALMLGLVRDRVMALCTQTVGSYRFFEDHSFLDVTPLFKVNPLGLVIEARRRLMSPDRLLAEGFEMEARYLHPGPGLKFAAPKLSSFARGKDLAALIDGMGTAEKFCRESGLEVLVGTLLILVLEDARLAFLSNEPKMVEESPVELDEEIEKDEGAFADLPTVDTPMSDLLGVSPEDRQAQEGLLLLYARLKPLTRPDQVLGLVGNTNPSAAEAAYTMLMSTLQEYQTGVGQDPLLRSRVDELKRKVNAAWNAVQTV
jgi:hypothetical protein